MSEIIGSRAVAQWMVAITATLADLSTLIPPFLSLHCWLVFASELDQLAGSMVTLEEEDHMEVNLLGEVVCLGLVDSG